MVRHSTTHSAQLNSVTHARTDDRAEGEEDREEEEEDREGEDRVAAEEGEEEPLLVAGGAVGAGLASTVAVTWLYLPFFMRPSSIRLNLVFFLTPPPAPLPPPFPPAPPSRWSWPPPSSSVERATSSSSSSTLSCSSSSSSTGSCRSGSEGRGEGGWEKEAEEEEEEVGRRGLGAIAGERRWTGEDESGWEEGG